MGNCNSSIMRNKNAKVSTRIGVRNPILYYCSRFLSCCNRRHFYITNNSESHASFAISPGPITDISGLTINKLGKINVRKRGKDKLQKFKILSQKNKSIRIHSRYFFVTVFLYIDDEWKPLWSNREISSVDDITIWDYHVQEASIDEAFQGITDEEDE